MVRTMTVRQALCALSALLAAVMSVANTGSAPGAESQKRAAVQPHHRSKAGATETKTKLYYRPFCRRSRYVTNRRAPCWS